MKRINPFPKDDSAASAAKKKNTPEVAPTLRETSTKSKKAPPETKEIDFREMQIAEPKLFNRVKQAADKFLAFTGTKARNFMQAEGVYKGLDALYPGITIDAWTSKNFSDLKTSIEPLDLSNAERRFLEHFEKQKIRFSHFSKASKEELTASSGEEGYITLKSGLKRIQDGEIKTLPSSQGDIGFNTNGFVFCSTSIGETDNKMISRFGPHRISFGHETEGANKALQSGIFYLQDMVKGINRESMSERLSPFPSESVHTICEVILSELYIFKGERLPLQDLQKCFKAKDIQKVYSYMIVKICRALPPKDAQKILKMHTAEALNNLITALFRAEVCIPGRLTLPAACYTRESELKKFEAQPPKNQEKTEEAVDFTAFMQNETLRERIEQTHSLYHPDLKAALEDKHYRDLAVNPDNKGFLDRFDEYKINGLVRGLQHPGFRNLTSHRLGQKLLTALAEKMSIQQILDQLEKGAFHGFSNMMNDQNVTALYNDLKGDRFVKCAEACQFENFRELAQTDSGQIIIKDSDNPNNFTFLAKALEYPRFMQTLTAEGGDKFYLSLNLKGEVTEVFAAAYEKDAFKTFADQNFEKLGKRLYALPEQEQTDFIRAVLASNDFANFLLTFKGSRIFRNFSSGKKRNPRKNFLQIVAKVYKDCEKSRAFIESARGGYIVSGMKEENLETLFKIYQENENFRNFINDDNMLRTDDADMFTCLFAGKHFTNVMKHPLLSELLSKRGYHESIDISENTNKKDDTTDALLEISKALDENEDIADHFKRTYQTLGFNISQTRDIVKALLTSPEHKAVIMENFDIFIKIPALVEDLPKITSLEALNEAVSYAKNLSYHGFQRKAFLEKNGKRV